MTEPDLNGRVPGGVSSASDMSSMTMSSMTTGRRPTQAELLIGYTRSAELFHAPDGEAYATVGVGGHRETCPLRRRRFTQWILKRFYADKGKGQSEQALTEARVTITAMAAFDGAELPVFVRVAGCGDAVYLDLCNEEWEAAEVTASGWR